ncbi:MAG: hypothetical protein CMO44_18765 [Verrucomicrobiales bacterium]|nr:hypothetical protein [Verrucomicrobiales bacterium]
MIDRSVLLWSAKEVRKKYRKMIKVNIILKELFDVHFPFVKPCSSNAWLLTQKDKQIRDAILLIPMLPYNLLHVENEFKEVYMRHLGIIAFFKSSVY